MTNGDSRIIGTMTINGTTFEVEEATPVDVQEDSVMYEVWVKRGDGNGESGEG